MIENSHWLSLMGSIRGFSGLYLIVVYKLGYDERLFFVPLQFLHKTVAPILTAVITSYQLTEVVWTWRKDDLLIFRRRTGVKWPEAKPDTAFSLFEQVFVHIVGLKAPNREWKVSSRVVDAQEWRRNAQRAPLTRKRRRKWRRELDF